MLKTQNKVLIIILSIFMILTACNKDNNVYLKDPNPQELVERFKAESMFTFSTVKMDEILTKKVGHSPAEHGNALLTLITNEDTNQLKELNLTYYIPDDIIKYKQEHLFNTIYLGLLLEEFEDFDEGNKWIKSEISKAESNINYTLNTSKIFNDKKVDLIITSKPFKKVNLTIKPKND